MLNKEEKTMDVKCPRCGYPMVLRTGKKSKFFGCVMYSKGCGGMLSMERAKEFAKNR